MIVESTVWLKPRARHTVGAQQAAVSRTGGLGAWWVCGRCRFLLSLRWARSISREAALSPLWSPSIPTAACPSSRLSLLLCFSTFANLLKCSLEPCGLVRKVCVLTTTCTWQVSLGYSGLSSFSSALSRISKIMTLNHNFPVNNNLFIVDTIKQTSRKKIKGQPCLCLDKCGHLSQHTLVDI